MHMRAFLPKLDGAAKGLLLRVGVPYTKVSGFPSKSSESIRLKE